ncbi:MAG TPA: FeoB small GTPase domain-containing protein, partial [Flavobacteriales bacterium]|nr:FeoB small GTPase domain-containing protein [Flavobacteriales bacterium]
MSKKKLKVALAGNPNSGKSTLFNSLTGLNQQVGNYPGITVDKRTGSCNVSDKVRAEVIDLPGTYSLYPKSLDEKVTQQILCNVDNKDYPDITVVVADSSNLRKSLLLLSQIIDLNMKVVLALNMLDVSRDLGIVIDVEVLSEELGIPVVSINARKQKGIEKLKKEILKVEKPKQTIFDVS